MRAVVVYPGTKRPPELATIPEPDLTVGHVKVKTLQVGVCGTDREILQHGHGRPPAGHDRLVLGHESLGRVEEVHDRVTTDLKPGDLVVATVRRPCHRCDACAGGMSDFCHSGDFVERGILGADGFMTERYVEDPAYLIRVPDELSNVGVLLEPLSVVEKALQQAFATQARIPGTRTAAFDPWQVGPAGWRPDRALVLGAGPIGMLAALLLRLAGSERVAIVERGRRPNKVRLLDGSGVDYRATEGAPLRDVFERERFDLIIEAAGSASAVVDALPLLAPNAAICLTGVFPGGEPIPIPIGDLLREMLYRNQALVTTVNSNRSYFERGVESMARLEARWPGRLAGLVTRRMPLAGYAEAVEPEREGVKTIVEVAAA